MAGLVSTWTSRPPPPSATPGPGPDCLAIALTVAMAEAQRYPEPHPPPEPDPLTYIVQAPAAVEEPMSLLRPGPLLCCRSPYNLTSSKLSSSPEICIDVPGIDGSCPGRAAGRAMGPCTPISVSSPTRAGCHWEMPLLGISISSFS